MKGSIMMKTGPIFNIQKFCIHDGDGIRTCVFLKGCPLRCVWCHNPEGLEKMPVISFDKTKCTSCGRCVSDCRARSINNGVLGFEREECISCGKCAELCINSANELIGREITVEEAFAEVAKDKMFYDTSGGGMTVTGGEPSLQAEFTLALLELARAEGISTAIETCGMGQRDFYQKAAELGATFLYDIKCIDPELHSKLTGADNTRILSNLRYLMDIGADIIIRLPLIPGCNDSERDIALLAELLNENKSRYRYAEIMPYHALGTGKSEKLGIPSDYARESATDKEISRWRALFTEYGADVRV